MEVNDSLSYYIHMEVNTTFSHHIHTEVNDTIYNPHSEISKRSAIIIFTFTAIIATSVCILNPLTIVAIVRTPSLRRCHSNIFLINLAVVDLLIMVLVVVFIVYHRLGSENMIICIFGGVYLGTVSVSSMLFCFAIAVDRFLFIHKALTYSGIVTHTRVIKVVASIWIVSLLIGCIPFMDGQICKDDYHRGEYVAVTIQGFIIFLMFCATGIISATLYVKLFFVIRDHNKVLETHALAHCRAHNCGSHACRVKTSLGECRFKHDSQTSSFAWAADGCQGNDHAEVKRLISNLRGSSDASLVTTDLKATSSVLFVQERETETSKVNPLSNQESERLSRGHGQNTIHNNRGKANHCDVKSQDNDFTKGTMSCGETCGTQNKNRPGRCQHLRDLRTIKTLMMMFAIYFICWAPLMVLKMTMHIFHHEVNHSWIDFAWISAVSNSVWNFVVYPLRKKDLRDAMLKMLRRCAGLQPNPEKPKSLCKDSGSESTHSSLKKTPSSTSRFY